MTDPDYKIYKKYFIDPIGYFGGRDADGYTIIYKKGVDTLQVIGRLKWLGDDTLWAIKEEMHKIEPVVETLLGITLAFEGGAIGAEAVAWLGGSSITTLGPIGYKVLEKADPNKIHHIFDKVEHNMSSLIGKFGSKEAAFDALRNITDSVVKSKGINGRFEIIVNIDGEAVTVTGNVINGVTKIGTAYK
jgi:hypothetical protein